MLGVEAQALTHLTNTARAVTRARILSAPERPMTPEATTPLEARAAHMDRSAKAFEQVKELFKTIGGAFLIALVFRSFVFDPFNIPSGSMVPRLLVGDYLWVSKWSYGYSRYSFPLGLDIFQGRLFDTAPTRGDVVVFKTPQDNSTDFIKRVIGLPGDQIQMRGGQVFINGVAVPKRRIEDFVVPMTPSDDCSRDHATADAPTRLPDGRQVCVYPQFEETLPGGRKIHVLDQIYSPRADDTQVYVVPADNYFMMGDNRDDSADSRFAVPEGIGFVPKENLVGKAQVTWFSIDYTAHWYEFWKWPLSIRLSRIGILL